MSDPTKKSLKKQGSLSCIEKSLKMISSPHQAPVTIYPGPKPGLQNLSKADLEIADRLEKLRKSSSTYIPSEEEMATRLAQLKGLPFDHYTKPSQLVYQTPDNRCQSEKSDDLLKQVMSEVSLEQKLPRFEDEIEVRLLNLKGITRDNSKQVKNAQSETFEDQAFLSSIGTDTADIDFKEITKSVRVSNEDAKKALASLDGGDPEIAAAIAQACAEIKEKKIKKYRKKAKHEKKSSTSDEERYSASDSEFLQKTSNSEEANKEKEEVDRIVKLYTEKEKLRKEKKKEKRKKLDENKKSSESDLSSSDSDIFTSESEKSSSDESD